MGDNTKSTMKDRIILIIGMTLMAIGELMKVLSQ
jgi:hypothetical protein